MTTEQVIQLFDKLYSHKISVLEATEIWLQSQAEKPQAEGLWEDVKYVADKMKPGCDAEQYRDELWDIIAKHEAK